MRLKNYGLVILGYALIILIVFGLEPFINSQKLLFGDDLHLTYYFFRSYFQKSVTEGFFPWWNPYLFSGSPYAAHPQALLPFYPIHWLFAVIPTALMFNWYIAWHILIAMVGMYFLANLFVHKKAAYVSGIVFGLSGFFMARVWAGHVDMIAAAAYLPWVFGFFWKAAETGKTRHIVLAAGALTLQLFVGYQTVALFTLEVVGIAALFLSVAGKTFRPLVRMLVAVFLGLGLAAVQLIPQQEFVSRSIRTFPFPYEWASAQKLTINQLKTLINPFLYGDQKNYTGPWPNLAEYAMYMGLIPLGLGILSLIGLVWQIWVKGKNKLAFPIVIFFLIAVFAIWISLANNAPFDLLYIFWKYVPVYDSIRIPTRHLILFVFGFSMLVGFSLSWLKNRIILAIIIILILFDLVPFSRKFIELKYIPEKRHDEKLIGFFNNDKSLFRILPNFGVWLEPRSSLDFDSAMTYKIFSTTGYDPSILRNYYEFIDTAGGHSTSSLLEHNVQVPYLDVNSPYVNFLNIKYLFVPNWLDPLGGISSSRYQLILDDAVRGYRLYENKNVIPRFYFVPELQTYPTRDLLMQAFAEGIPDLKKSVLTSDRVEGSIRKECTQGMTGQVDIVSYSPNDIALRVNASCDNFLVSSEVMYPGWEAAIDGKQTNIFEGNLAFRTILVPQGQHTVTYHYNPKIFLIGGGVSGVFVILAIILYRKNWTI